MSGTTRYCGLERQATVFATLIRRMAPAICMAVLILAGVPCSSAASSPTDAPQADKVPVLTLEEVMQMAESSSPSVASAKRDLELALLQVKAAEARGLPSVVVRAAPLQVQAGPFGLGNMGEGDREQVPGGEMSISVLSQVGGDVLIPLGRGSLSLSASTFTPISGPAPTGKSAWTGSASLSLPVLGAKSQSEATQSIRSAEAQVRGAQFQLEQAIRRAHASAQAAYFGFLAADDRVAAADRGLARARSHAAFVEGRRSLGNASELDTLEARASVARAEATAESARHNLTIASMSLNQAIGRPLETPVRLAPAGEYAAWPKDMDLDACVQAALEARPELLMVRQDVADADAALARANAAKRPDVLLKGQASTGGSWRVGLEVSALLMRDYAAEIAIESAKGQAEQAKADVVKTRDSIVLEVVEAFYGLHEAERAVELARSTVAITIATLEVKEKQCQIGGAAYAEVSEAIEAVRKAESDLVSQLASCFAAKSGLLASMGRDVD